MNEIEILQRDFDFYNTAVELAHLSDYTTRVGCIAAKGQKKICGAVNTIRNPAFNVPVGEATKHAEWNCLTQLNSCDKVTLYIARVGKLDQELPSRPCHRCMIAVRNSGIR